MAEVAGLIKCPICGREDQEIRINKNLNLYTYCENGCKMTFSAGTSRKALPVLKSGRIYTYNGYELRPLQKKQETNINQPAGIVTAEKTEVKTYGTDDNRGTQAVGRPDGESAAAARNAGGREYRPSGLAAWLWGDDDSDD